MVQSRQATKAAEIFAEPPPDPQTTTGVQELKVTGHMMSLPAGLFCFVNEMNPASAPARHARGARLAAALGDREC
jgi:hypothetical protein